MGSGGVKVRRPRAGLTAFKLHPLYLVSRAQPNEAGLAPGPICKEIPTRTLPGFLVRVLANYNASLKTVVPDIGIVPIKILCTLVLVTAFVGILVLDYNAK
jgi:hypothetical protein